MASSPKKVNPNVGYELDAIDLNGGLDFTASKMKAVPGTLLDCQNYEVVDKQGYQRIAGMEPYDGRVSPAMDTYYRIESTTFAGDFPDDFPIGSLLVIAGSENIFGIVVELTAIGGEDTINYARINRDFEPKVGDNVTTLGGSVNFPVSTAPLSANEGYAVPLEAKAIIDKINGFSGTLRSRISDLESTPIGLHWFRDRLYAVVDEAILYFNSGGTTELMPNMLIEGATSGATGRVLDIVLKSGTWAAGTANGAILIERTNTAAFTTSENIDVTSAPTTSNIATLRAKVSGDIEARFAGIWQSRSEQQAQDELNDADDAGWKRIESGWEVDYIEGLSDSGVLTRIERGKENNFIYAVGDEEGKSIIFRNGAKIPTDSPAGGGLSGTKVSSGDPGWKDSDNTAIFATTQDALDSTDSRYLYGDLQFAASAIVSSGDLQIRPYNIINAPDSASPDPGLTDGGSTNSRVPLIFKNLSAIGAAVPDNSVITGIEIEMVYNSYLGYYGVMRNAFTPRTYIPQWVTGKVLLSAYLGMHVDDTNTFTPMGTKQTTPQPVETDPLDYTYNSAPYQTGTQSFDGYATLSGVTTSIGGNGNIFGASQLSKEDLVQNTNLSLALFVDGLQNSDYPEGQLASFGGSNYEQVRMDVRTLLNRLRIKVYYTEPSARYYITDNDTTDVNILSADLVYYDVLDGSLQTGNATGKMQFVNIQPVAGNKRTILKGDTIHVANPPSPANRVARVDDDGGTNTGDVGMVLNGLPPKEAIIEESSRYQFITANFFAKEDWDGFYGVSGAGKAFSFSEFDSDGDGDDDQYVIKITSNELDEEGDKPRHIAFHHYALALGFDSGVVRLSVPGEPENFDGLQGAAEVGVGDKVTGLLSLQGVTLAVGCENSIQSIAGSDADNYTTQTISPSTGVLEYTMVDMGIPVYCDSRGISTLSQSERYGNFLGQRLSAPITSWIAPRMLRSPTLFSLASGAGVSCALPVRSKNQYRVFFRDGEGLTMTMNVDGTVAFTFFNYYLNQTAFTNTNNFVVPFAWSSQVDDRGVERIHISHFSPFSAVESNYVYELEQGWSFAGKFIPAYYDVNWYYKNPYAEKTIRKVRIDGLSRGFGSGEMTIAKDYSETYRKTTTPASLPQRQYAGLTPDYRPATCMVQEAYRGRNLSFRVADVVPNGDTIDDPIPSTIHQVMLLQYQVGGDEDS